MIGFIALAILLKKGKSPLLANLAVCLLIIASGTLYGARYRSRQIEHPLRETASHEPLSAFRVMILEDTLSAAGKHSRLARLESLAYKGRVIHRPGKIWLMMPESVNPPCGALIEGIGKLKPLPRPRNPGEFDFEDYSQRKGVFAVIEVRPGESKVVGTSGCALKRKVQIPLRSSLAASIDHHIGGEEADILKALTLGLRTGLESGFKRDLRLSGLWHLLSLSGLHLGMFAGMVLIVLILCRVPLDFRWGLAIGAVIAYCLIAEARPPMVRAALIITLLFASRYLNRCLDRWNLLALSALVILLFSPGELLAPGFQLSFAAAACILAAYEKWGGLLQPGSPLKSRFRKYILGLLAASLAASLGTAPFLAYHFGGVPLASIPAGLVGVPLTGLILALFPLFYVSSLIFAPAAALLGNTLWLLTHILKVLVEFSAKTGLYLSTPEFTLYHLLLLEIPLLLLIAGRREWLWAALVAANVFAWKPALKPYRCKLTCLDVGQGNCALVELPGGKCLIVDAGPAHFSFNAGERTVAPCLYAKGIDRIDRLILTHPDIDHVGGADYLLNAFGAEALVIGPAGPESSGDWEIIRQKTGGYLKIGGALLLFFNPPRPSEDDNSASLVFTLIYGKSSALFTGDIPASVERELLPFADLLKADILMVSHHGSAYSSSPPFLKAVSPKYALVSCGRNNRYRHPAPETIRRLENSGALIHRTDLSQAAVFELNRSRVIPLEWRRR